MDGKRSVGDPPTSILHGYKGGRVALPPFTLIDEACFGDYTLHL